MLERRKIERIHSTYLYILTRICIKRIKEDVTGSIVIRIEQDENLQFDAIIDKKIKGVYIR